MAHVFRMPSPVNAAATVYVAAAGDIGDPRIAGGMAFKTGRLLDDLIARYPDFTPSDGQARHLISVDPLGDLAYPDGSSSNFSQNYTPYWGTGAGKPATDSWVYGDKGPYTWPTIGNHESYNDTQTVPPLEEYAPYDDLFGLRGQGTSLNPDVYKGYYPGRGLPGGRYYARDMVAPDGKAYWLHIHYNSHVGEAGEVDSYTRQLDWFDAMIACAGSTGTTTPTVRANGSNLSRHVGFRQHILVSGHHPLMAVSRKVVAGVEQGSNGEPAQDQYWVKLQNYTGGLKVMLAGHYHYYARFEPVRWKSVNESTGDPAASIAATVQNGVVLILNGCGGANLNTIGSLSAHLDHVDKGIDTSYVVSHLMLEPHRLMGEAVAIDDASLGLSYDPPFELLWAAPSTTATLSVTPASVQPGEQVTAVVSTVGGTLATNPYAINWGDNTSSVRQASATFTHTYTAAGNYTVTATITKSDNTTITATDTVVVAATGALTAVVVLTPGASVPLGQPITADASASQARA